MAANVEMQGLQLSDIELLAAVTLISGLQMGKTIEAIISVSSYVASLPYLSAVTW